MVTCLHRRPLADAKASSTIKDTAPTVPLTPEARYGILERIADSTELSACSTTPLGGGVSIKAATGFTKADTGFAMAAKADTGSTNVAHPPISIEKAARMISLIFPIEAITTNQCLPVNGVVKSDQFSGRQQKVRIRLKAKT